MLDVHGSQCSLLWRVCSKERIHHFKNAIMFGTVFNLFFIELKLLQAENSSL